MGTAKSPKPVKLIVSAFGANEQLLGQSKALLQDEWGAVDFESDLLPFEHTPYYEAEFGPGLVRRIWSFVPLIDPADLSAIKLRTNAFEQRLAEDGKRCVDLDSGYVSLAKLILGTTKNHAHRIYIGQGIYAEVTLTYRAKAFHSWPWTYPDYATPQYCTIFETIRRIYLEQLRAG